jgi:hypothetical protein
MLRDTTDRGDPCLKFLTKQSNRLAPMNERF